MSSQGNPFEVKPIDIFNLHEEAANHCAEYQVVSEAYCLAEKELSDHKAMLDEDIRNNPEQYGLSKVTETGVSSAILYDKNAILLTHKVNRLKGLKKALEMRKTMIEVLANLYGHQYFSIPNTKVVIENLQVNADIASQQMQRHLSASPETKKKLGRKKL